MSTPKTVLNPRVKISKTGRPYVDVADLVKSELERMKKPQEESSQEPSTQPDADNPNGNGTAQEHLDR